MPTVTLSPFKRINDRKIFIRIIFKQLLLSPFTPWRDMKKRKTYSGAFKARVISDLISGKKDLTDLANDYQIHPNQIKNWRTTLFKRAHLILDDRRHNKNNIWC